MVEVTTSKATLEWEFESMDPRVGPKRVRCQAVPLDDGVALSLRDVTAQKTAESELDELTQLPNRRAFRRMVAQELKTGPRAGRRGAAL